MIDTPYIKVTDVRLSAHDIDERTRPGKVGDLKGVEIITPGCGCCQENIFIAVSDNALECVDAYIEQLKATLKEMKSLRAEIVKAQGATNG